MAAFASSSQRYGSTPRAYLGPFVTRAREVLFDHLALKADAAARVEHAFDRDLHVLEVTRYERADPIDVLLMAHAGRAIEVKPLVIRLIEGFASNHGSSFV